MKKNIGNVLGIKTVLIEPTNDCQLDCVTCYRKGREVGYMSMQTFDAALKSLPIRTYAINLNGAGEPLLHPEFAAMVDKLNAKRNPFGMKYKTGFSTNGLLLDSAIQKKIIDKVDWINISLDGIGAKHESRRRGSNWDIVSENAHKLIDRARRRTKISVNLTRFGQTDDEISDFKKYWQSADSVFVTTWHNAAMQERGKKMSKCDVLYNNRFILWNGDITTCCGDLRGINVYGNLGSNPKPKYGPLCETCTVRR